MTHEKAFHDNKTKIDAAEQRIHYWELHHSIPTPEELVWGRIRSKSLFQRYDTEERESMH